MAKTDTRTHISYYSDVNSGNLYAHNERDGLDADWDGVPESSIEDALYNGLGFDYAEDEAEARAEVAGIVAGTHADYRVTEARGYGRPSADPDDGNYVPHGHDGWCDNEGRL